MAERFELLERVGEGGMGAVWKARDRETGDVVALKLLHPHLARQADYIARFEREVEVARRIDSPNVVRTLGFGEHEGQPFIAMEYVEGQSLKDLLRDKGKLSWDEARPIVRDVLHGLEAAHRVNVIHRDIKPGNILITSDGTAKIADFGIARAADLTAMTGTSTMLGTPHYMAPDSPISERSDLYSLGCVAFEMLTGRPPFDGDNQSEVIRAHVVEPPDLGRVQHAEAKRFVAELLQKDAKARPNSAWTALTNLNFDGSGWVPAQHRTTSSGTQSQRPLRRFLTAGVLLLCTAAAAVVGLALVQVDGGGERPSSPIETATPTPVATVSPMATPTRTTATPPISTTIPAAAAGSTSSPTPVPPVPTPTPISTTIPAAEAGTTSSPTPPPLPTLIPTATISSVPTVGALDYIRFFSIGPGVVQRSANDTIQLVVQFGLFSASETQIQFAMRAYSDKGCSPSSIVNMTPSGSREVNSGESLAAISYQLPSLDAAIESISFRGTMIPMIPTGMEFNSTCVEVID